MKTLSVAVRETVVKVQRYHAVLTLDRKSRRLLSALDEKYERATNRIAGSLRSLNTEIEKFNRTMTQLEEEMRDLLHDEFERVEEEAQSTEYDVNQACKVFDLSTALYDEFMPRMAEANSLLELPREFGSLVQAFADRAEIEIEVENEEDCPSS